MPRHQHRQHQDMVCLADVNLEEGEEGCKSEEDTRAVLYIKDESASKGDKSRQVASLQVHPEPRQYLLTSLIIVVQDIGSGRATCV